MMWLEWLAATILFVAVVTAFAARMRSGRRRVILCIVAALLPLAKGAALAALFGYIALITLRPWYTYHWFVFWFMLTACSAIGTFVVLVRGLRKRGDLMPKAASWPRGKLALALAAVLLLSWMTFWNLDLSVKGRLASLRAEAGALALSTVPPRPLEAENAALVYRQAFDAMLTGDDLPPEYKKWTASTEGEGDADFDPADPKLEAFLARSEGALGLLRRASAMPACYFDHDYGRPSFSMSLPEMEDFRNAARLLALDARVKAAHGQMPRAMEDVRAMFALARHGMTNPILVPLLIACGTDEMAVHTLEAVLKSAQPPAPLLAGLGLSASEEYGRNLPRVFRMEEAFVVSAMVDIGIGEDVSVQEAMGFPGAPRPVLQEVLTDPLLAGWRVFLAQEEMVAYRAGIREYQRLAAMPYYEAAKEWRELAEPANICRRGIMAAMLMPAIGQCATVVTRADARHAVACMAVAAARYRAEKGRLPETLDALVPEYLPAVPRDPFDGKPLRMVARDGRLVFYSIGPDMKDDGGAVFDEENHTGDIIFSLPLNLPKPSETH
jgi:hypothetical protein